MGATSAWSASDRSSCENRVEDSKPFRCGGPEKAVVGAGKEDLHPFLVEEQSACEVNSIGASKRTPLTESGYKSEDLGADRNLHELLPIIRETKTEHLELRGKQEPFPTAASKRRVDLGEREQ